jgi:hypothetical protein
MIPPAIIYRFFGAALPTLAMLLCATGFAQPFPPLGIEISADHPLFIFQNHGPANATPEQYAQHAIDVFGQLPDRLKPYSLIQIDAGRANPEMRHQRYMALLAPLQDAGLQVLVRVADTDPRERYALDRLEALLRAFPIVKGIEITGMDFNVYDPGFSGEPGMSPEVRWLIGAIDIAARYGRFAYLSFEGMKWPRIMANVASAPLYEKIRECRDYVIPACLHRGPHTIAGTSALMGLWIEDAVAQWGIAADSRWYSDAWFAGPDRFGASSTGSPVPSTLYRAMILNGAMTGAAVYSFSLDLDLWFGPARHHWDEAILPTLHEILDLGLVARKDFVQKRTSVAYQLDPAATPAEFHLNLRDIDGILDQGLLIEVAYGMERPGQIPELIPNRGDRFWIPFLSPYAGEAVSGSFEAVAQPGMFNSARDWSEWLDRYSERAGEGSAFITHVGRGLFILNTRENTLETQSFAVDEAPAPVRGLLARREGAAVELTWPFREGDVSYKVYKRLPPETHYSLIANGIDRRRFIDDAVDMNATVAYAVTALTNEKEPFQGAVGHGDYFAFSMVESRIAEEALLNPLLSNAESSPLSEDVSHLMMSVSPEGRGWWPGFDGLTEEEQRQAQAIVDRIEAWDRGFTRSDLNAVLDIYATGYEDPQGWRFQYVRRAYQWFFERYRRPLMHRQIRRWDFSTLPGAGRINVLMYCRLTGTAISDSSGRIADLQVAIPRTDTAEVWVSWEVQDGVWRIVSTNPALPNFRELLSYSAGPYDEFPAGPDYFSGP